MSEKNVRFWGMVRGVGELCRSQRNATAAVGRGSDCGGGGGSKLGGSQVWFFMRCYLWAWLLLLLLFRRPHQRLFLLPAPLLLTIKAFRITKFFAKLRGGRRNKKWSLLMWCRHPKPPVANGVIGGPKTKQNLRNVNYLLR